MESSICFYLFDSLCTIASWRFPLLISLSGWRSRLLEPSVSGSCISRLTETCGTKFNKKGGTFHLTAIPLYIFSLVEKTSLWIFISLPPFPPSLFVSSWSEAGRGAVNMGFPFFLLSHCSEWHYSSYVYIHPSFSLSLGLVFLLHSIGSVGRSPVLSSSSMILHVK